MAAGATPLHRAAGVSSTACVQALLTARADVNAVHSTNKRHPMDMANSAVQAVLRAAGGVRANLAAGAPSSRAAFPERSRQPRAEGQEVSSRRRERTEAFRAEKGKGGKGGGGKGRGRNRPDVRD